MAKRPPLVLEYDVLVSHTLRILAALVTRHSCAPERDALRDLLECIALWCRAARRAVQSEPAYAPLLYYERARRASLAFCHRAHDARAEERFFFEGVPQSVDVVGRCTATELTPDIVGRALQFTWQDVKDDRRRSVYELERGQSPLPCDDADSDLHEAVPDVVRSYIQRQQQLFASLRKHKSAASFVQCDNQSCARLFMIPHGVGTARFDAPARPVADYWDTIEPVAAVANDESRFCCSSCAREWWLQIGAYDVAAHSFAPRFLGMGADAAEGTNVVDRLGAEKRSLSWKRALRRNHDLKEELDRLSRRRPRLTAVSLREHRSIVDALVVRANVDLGVLQVADQLMHCTSLRRRVRESGLSLATTLARIRSVYRQYASPRPITKIQFERPPFLRALCTHLASVIATPRCRDSESTTTPHA